MEQLVSELQLIARYGSAMALLGWDEEVNLASKGHQFRGEVNALLSGVVHRRVTDKSFLKLVAELCEPTVYDKLDDSSQIIVSNIKRDTDRASKIPAGFVEELSQSTTEAFRAWVEARQKSDFTIFAPVLEKLVNMKRRQAEMLGYAESPYDALLDEFEPEMTSQTISKLFTPLAENIRDCIKIAAKNKYFALPPKDYPVAKQDAMVKEVAAAIGYDFDAGNISISPHPFTITLHSTDVRITTKFNPKDFWVSLGSTIHEVGHALYEQGLPAKYFGTPLAESVSLGIHESQSRIWENFIGRGPAFSRYLYPLLQKYFGETNITYSQAELHKALNQVKPNLIRIESDEVTYNMHIILRFELEKDLIENKLKVKDLPFAWNEKVEHYLGIKVPNDADGVLQDVHWSHGSFGYFPTYTLGNIYAAQLYETAQKAIPELENNFAKGNFQPFLSWLRENIHSQGRRYSAQDLISRVTGQQLDAGPLVERLRVIAGQSFKK